MWSNVVIRIRVLFNRIARMIFGDTKYHTLPYTTVHNKQSNIIPYILLCSIGVLLFALAYILTPQHMILSPTLYQPIQYNLHTQLLHTDTTATNVLIVHSRIPHAEQYGCDNRFNQFLDELNQYAQHHKQHNIQYTYAAWRTTNEDSTTQYNILQEQNIQNIIIPLDTGNYCNDCTATYIQPHELICSQSYSVIYIYMWIEPYSYWLYILELITTVKQISPQTVIVLIADDINYMRQQAISDALQYDTLNTVESQRLHKLSQRIQPIELYTLMSADYIGVVTEDDAHAIQQSANTLQSDVQLHVLHYIADSISTNTVQHNTFAQRNTLVFVGSANEINRLSLQYLFESIIPLLHKQLPDIQINIIGSVQCPVCQSYNYNNIHWLGQIDDLSTVLDTAKVFISPIIAGTGINTKNILALQYGIPLITTTVGSRALYLNTVHKHNNLDCTGATVVDTSNAQQFTDAVVQYYTMDEQEWLHASETAQQHAAEYFNRNVLTEDVTKLMTDVVNSVNSRKTEKLNTCHALWQIEQMRTDYSDIQY